MSLGVYAAASLGMDGMGVYCNWEMPGSGSIIPYTTFLGKRAFSATRVLVVCSACQVLVFVNRWLWGGLPAGVGSLGAIGPLSVIPGWTPSCTVSHSSALLGILSSPSFPRVDPYIVCVLFPHPIHLPPSCSPLSSPFFCPFTPF